MQRKLSLLYEIFRQTAQEYGYVSEESIDLLCNVIDEKQKIIDEIDVLDRVFLEEYAALKAALGLCAPGGIGGAPPQGRAEATDFGAGAAGNASEHVNADASRGMSAGRMSGEMSELKLNTAEIVSILTKIEALDTKVNQKMAKLREDLAADLVKIRKQRHVNSIYGGEGANRGGGAAAKPSGAYRSSFDRKN
jgi:uncharacterized protein YdcH (DUF465 family)